MTTARASYVVPAKTKSFNKLTEGEQLAVQRITSAMGASANWDFVRLDDLLFSDEN